MALDALNPVAVVVPPAPAPIDVGQAAPVPAKTDAAPVDVQVPNKDGGTTIVPAPVAATTPGATAVAARVGALAEPVPTPGKLDVFKSDWKRILPLLLKWPPAVSVF